MSLFCVLGPEADRFNPGSAKPASKYHQTDAQSHHDGRPAPERGDKHFDLKKVNVWWTGFYTNVHLNGNLNLYLVT